LRDDIDVVLNNVSLDDNYDADYNQRREVIWTLDFTVKTYFYGPVREDELITKIQVDTRIPMTGDDLDDIKTKELDKKIPRSMRVTVEPDPIDATPDNAYGFTETIEEFNDGKRYDPVSGDDVDVDDREPEDYPGVDDD
jgi:hypothetical protein